MTKLEMKNYSMISIEKLQKYQPYHQAKLMLPSNQKQIIEQPNFTYSPLEKSFKKQTKTIKGQGEEQFDALKTI